MSLNTVQSEAFAKLSRLKAGALFMGMGTGKTKVALDLAISRQEDYDVLIWIAPSSLLRSTNYQQEITKWSAGLTKTITNFSIESISQSDEKYLELRSLAERNRCFCVVDESITIKNSESKRTTRLLDMWQFFDFRLILNGTPVSKNLADLYSQMRFIHPKIFDMTERSFAEKFLVFKDEGERPWQRWSKPANEAALVEIIRPYIFDAQLEVPVGLTSDDHWYYLSEFEQDEYWQIKHEFMEQAAEEINFLAIAQKLQGFYSGCRTKFDDIPRVVEDGQHIIYVKFIANIDALERVLPAFIEYSGRKKGDLTRFTSGEERLLVMTYGAGSMGLNLQNCNSVIFFDQTFDQKDKLQALHRVYRTGQKRDVKVTNMWVETGLERIIRKSTMKKQSTIRNLQKFIEADGIEAL